MILSRSVDAQPLGDALTHGCVLGFEARAPCDGIEPRPTNGRKRHLCVSVGEGDVLLPSIPCVVPALLPFVHAGNRRQCATTARVVTLRLCDAGGFTVGPQSVGRVALRLRHGPEQELRQRAPRIACRCIAKSRRSGVELALTKRLGATVEGGLEGRYLAG